MPLEEHHDHDVLYQLQLRSQELCRLCAIWQRKIRSLPKSNHEQSWGPSDAEVQASAVSEVTENWAEEASDSEEEISEQSEDDIDNLDWEDWEDGENNGELMESLEAIALSDQYHVDDAADLAYSLSDMSVQEFHHGSSMSPSKRSRNV